jgi:hypothetical protein
MKNYRTSRTLLLILGGVALAIFTYSGGGAAAADSMSGKWLSPARCKKESNRIDTRFYRCRSETLFEDLYDVSRKDRGRRRPGGD